MLQCPPIRHKREGSIKEFSKDLSQLGTHIKNWLTDKTTHHCKIFWSRGGNKGYGGGEQLVEEEDRAGQVQLQHHPQLVWQQPQPLTGRAGTWESPASISTPARFVSTSVKITLQMFYTPSPPLCPSYRFCRQILPLLLTMSSKNKDVRGIVQVFQINQRHRIEMLFWCSHYICFTFLLKHQKMVSNDVRHPVCRKELIMIPIFVSIHWLWNNLFLLCVQQCRYISFKPNQNCFLWILLAILLIILTTVLHSTIDNS